MHSSQAEPGDETTRNKKINQVDEVRRPEPGPPTRLDVVVRIFPGGPAPIDPIQVEQLVSATAGLDPTRGDTITVTAAPR